jgi:hypothetical protein
MTLIQKRKLGFTGSQETPTPAQIKSAKKWVMSQTYIEGHHGDCIGSDAAFHLICRAVGIRIVVHPPVIKTKRAFLVGDETRALADYLPRNRNIVHATAALLAMPSGPETQRSGTWSTVRYARGLRKEHKLKYPIYIVWRDGSVTEDTL